MFAEPLHLKTKKMEDKFYPVLGEIPSLGFGNKL